jgi:hypothetical protein
MTVDINANLAAFLQDRTPEARYASFDYCFNYFQEARDSGNTAQLADDEHRMLSCFQLGFFLASWGMMRGSGDLYQRSVRDLLRRVRGLHGLMAHHRDPAGQDQQHVPGPGDRERGGPQPVHRGDAADLGGGQQPAAQEGEQRADGVASEPGQPGVDGIANLAGDVEQPAASHRLLTRRPGT